MRKKIIHIVVLGLCTSSLSTLAMHTQKKTPIRIMVKPPKHTTKNPYDLYDLPAEILCYEIFSYLKNKELCNMQAVSRYFKKLVEQEIIIIHPNKILQLSTPSRIKTELTKVFAPCWLKEQMPPLNLDYINRKLGSVEFSF